MRLFCRKTLSALVALVGMSSLTSAFSAESLYVWVDAKGVTHITAEPPQDSSQINPRKTQVLRVDSSVQKSGSIADALPQAVPAEAAPGAPAETTEQAKPSYTQRALETMGMKPQQAKIMAAVPNEFIPGTDDKSSPKEENAQEKAAEAKKIELINAVQAEIESVQSQLNTVKKRVHIAKANGDRSKLSHLRRQNIKLMNQLQELQKKAKAIQ